MLYGCLTALMVNYLYTLLNLELHFREALSWQWNLSIRPLAIGLRLDPSNCINCCQSADSNCLPWSVVIVDGIPNLAIQPLRKAWATDTAVIILTEIASAQHVKWSIQVRIYVYLLEGGSRPTMSMWMLSSLMSGVAKGVTVCLCTLHFWHFNQVCAQLQMSLLILGET